MEERSKGWEEEQRERLGERAERGSQAERSKSILPSESVSLGISTALPGLGEGGWSPAGVQ